MSGWRLVVIGCLILSALPEAGRASSVLLPVLGRGSSYAESYTFVGDLADGTYVQLTFSFTNLGPGPTKGICRVVVARVGHPPWKTSERVGRKDWSYSSTPEERLSIGPCAVTYGPLVTLIQADLDGGTIRLSIAAPLKPQAPPDAFVTIGLDHYRTEILLYRAPLEAVITLPGETARTLSGSGYADHSRSTVQPKDLAVRWVRFRGLRGDRGLLLLARESAENEFRPVWSCETLGHWREYTRFQLNRSGDSEETPSFHVQLSGKAGGLEVRSTALLLRDAPVEDLGLLGKIVAPFVGSPVTYVFRARASGNGGPEVEGILEVELADE